jgi:hypothetical protein
MSLPSRSRWGEPALRHVVSWDWFSGERLVAIAAGLIWLALVVRGVVW